MKKSNLSLVSIFILVVPLIVILCLGIKNKAHFFNENFWIAYMAFFGTVTVAWASLWQSIKNEEKAIILQKQQQQDQYINENLLTEHPLIKITSVKLYGAIGHQLLEEYSPSESTDKLFIGSQLEGNLSIEIDNIGNGLLLNMKHKGMNDVYASENSKSLAPSQKGHIELFYERMPSKDEIYITYTNIRGFEYSQKLLINIEDLDHYDYRLDENGNIIDNSIKGTGTTYTVYVSLSEQNYTEKNTLPT